MQNENLGDKVKLDKATVARRLRQASLKAKSLAGSPEAGGDAFRSWYEPAALCVRRIYGEASPEHERLRRAVSPGERAHEDDLADRWGCLAEAEKILDLCAHDVETYWTEKPEDSVAGTVASTLKAFPQAVRSLRDRRVGRTPLGIADEYDVQYLLRALLCLQSSDVRSEEPTPSCGGACARMDFFLADRRLAVEAKMTRRNLRDSQVFDELVLDVRRYQERADCDALVCFIYDPGKLLRNPAGLARDVERTPSRMLIRAVVAA